MKTSSPMMRFWRSALVLFVAMRLADLCNAITGLWVVPKGIPAETLGAVLPMLQFGTVLAFPAGVLVTVFTRYLCLYVVAGDDLRARALLRDTLLVVGGVLLVALGVAGALMPWLCDLLRVPKTSAAFFAVGYALLATFVPMVSAAVQALKKFGVLSVASLLAAPSRLVAMLLLLPVAGLTGYFLGQTAPLLVTLAVGLVALRPLLRARGAHLPFGAWLGQGREMGQYAVRVAIVAGVAAVQGTVLAFVVRSRLTDDASAGYYVISRFAEIVTYCGSTLAVVLFPYAVEASVKGSWIAKIRNSVIAVVLLGGCLFSGVLVAVLPFVFRHIAGFERYLPYVWHAGCLALTTTLNVACSGYFTCATARNDFHWLWYVIPCSAILSLALLLSPIASLGTFCLLLLLAATIQLICVLADMYLHEGKNSFSFLPPRG